MDIPKRFYFALQNLDKSRTYLGGTLNLQTGGDSTFLLRQPAHIGQATRPLSLPFYSLAVISLTSNFYIQKFYMVFTLPCSVLYGLSPSTTLTDWVCVSEVESVYCTVCTESLHETDTLLL
jgi:hypothetical protein